MSAEPVTLNNHPLLWRGKQHKHQLATLSTGHAVLDAVLPGHGWPKAAITELIYTYAGCGEFSLLLPALAALSQSQQSIVMIDPPWVPYPPALYGRGLELNKLLLIQTRNRGESLWACEQVLRGMPGGALLAWPETLSFSELRRLQLSAKSGQKTVFLFRKASAAAESSPAALRLQLKAGKGKLNIRVLKCRGQRATTDISIRQSQLSQTETTAADVGSAPSRCYHDAAKIRAETLCNYPL